MRKIYIVALATLSVLFSFVPAYAQGEIDVTKYFSITAISGAKTVKLQRTDANYNPSITKDTEFDLWYSTNNCATWTRWATPTSSTISIAKGTTTYFKGVNPKGFGRPDGICSWQFLFAGNYTFSVQGDIMSLVQGDFVDYGDGTTNFDTIPADYCFDKLFSQAHAKSYLMTAANLTLSAKYLTKGCYRQMFLGLIHTSFTTTPSINAVDVQESSFESMFEGCTKLVNVASPLPQVETIPEAGFKRMFYNCNALKSTENISLGEQVKVIETEGCSQMYWTCKAAGFTSTYNNFPNLDYIGESGCYQMYYGDLYLTSTPHIKAKRIYPYGCQQMFLGCQRLTFISALETQELDEQAWQQMFYQTCSTSIAPNAQVESIKIDSVGYQGCHQMFFWPKTGTSGVMYRSALSAVGPIDIRIVGEQGCYQMFHYLYLNLRDLPQMHFERVYDSGCYMMFANCSGIKHVGGFVCPEVGRSGCESMFNGCTALQTIEELDIDKIGPRGCLAMFNGCAPLDSIPVKMMEIEQLGDSGCYQMFSGCKTYLTKIADLNVGEIGAGGCFQMFNGCAALTSIPAIKARKVGNKAMQQMFNGAATGQYAAASTILIDTVGVDGCYLMFDGVTKLNQIDSIGFRLIEDGGLYQMFRGCTSLTTAPKIYAQRVDTQACTYMFDNCSALTSIPYFQIDTIGYQGCYRMMYNNTKALHTKLSTFLPIKAKLIRSYGCQEMFRTYPSSTDGSNYNTLLTSFGGLEADEIETNGCYQMFFRCNKLATFGDISVKKVGDHGLDLMFNTACTALATVGNLTFDEVGDYGCSKMFSGCTALANIGNITVGRVGNHGMASMFTPSANVTNVGAISIESLADSACFQMFYNCTKLATIPSLSIGKADEPISIGACEHMFSGCTVLNFTNAPVLSATNIGEDAYADMFLNCKALTNAPTTLPAPTIPRYGYWEMFKGCVALENAPSLDAMTSFSGDSACYAMFSGCTKLSNFSQKLKPTTLRPATYYQMFVGCSSLKTAPEIDANLIPYRACDSMFVGSGITAIPEMPNLTTIEDYGCKEMFRSCAGIRKMDNWHWDEVAPYGCQLMFVSCANLDTVTNLTINHVSHNGLDQMFSTSGIDTIGNIYTKKVDNQGCYRMFTGCTTLKKAGLLKADTVGYQGWYQMFYGASTTAGSKYDSISVGLVDTLGMQQMFYYCTGMAQAPSLYANKLDSAALNLMYQRCTSNFTMNSFVVDTIEPMACCKMCTTYVESKKTYSTNLTAINNPIRVKIVKPLGCYQMFQSPGLLSLPAMRADTIQERGCYQMTKGSSGLNTIGDLQAAFLQDSACAFMFNTCTALKNIGTLTAKYDNASAYYRMFYNCPIATFGNIEVDTIRPYAYKTLFNNLTSITNFGKIKANVVMEHGLDSLFRNSTKLVSVDSIILGDVADSACYEMFAGCTALTTIPYLKIGTEGRRVGLHALCRMFQGDKKLDILETPLLPASKLKNGAYEQMFETCEALTHAPLLLNADSVGTCVYKQMFNGCKLLPEAPATLPLAAVPHKGYFEMFKGCVALETAPSLDAMTSFSGDSACYAMFSGCTKLSSFSQKLKPTTLRPATYYQMFVGCSSLKTAPEIDANLIPYRACDSMFVGSGITAIPEMPNLTTIEDYGCKEMFRSCAGLRKMDNWHWDEVAPYGCQLMFASCANLDTVTNLTINHVLHNGLDQMFSAAGIDTIGNIYTKKVDNQGCYRMFTGCTTLKNAGLLKADTVGYQGWQEMFNGCSASAARFDSVSIGLADTLGLYRMFNVCLNLNQGPAMYIQKADSAALFEMYRGCYNTAFTIPTIVIDTIEPYACRNMCMNYTEKISNKTSTRNALVSSIPNGIHAKVVKPYGCYQMFNPATSLATIGNLTADTIQEHGCYQMTKSCSALTTISDLQAQYLADSACAYMFNTATKLNTIGSLHTDKYTNTSSFHQMFYDCPMAHIGSIITDTIHKGDFDVLFNSLTNLATFGCLKADVVLENGLKSWFAGRTKLTDVDSIILGDVRDSACYEMFKGCTLLDTIPYLQIGTAGKRVGKHALCRMFQGDTKLRIAKAPVLAATTLKEGAYQQMFENCSSLQYSPAYLPADSVGHLGYMQMFNGCAALTTSPASLPLDVVSDSLYYQMFAGCASLPVAVGVLGPSSVGKKGYYEMYKGCSSLVTAPQMPNLVSVGDSTCMGMYNGCQSLVNLGTWQPEHVGKSACQDMFSGCSSLADASPFRLKAETIDTLSFYRMFANCAALTTAPRIDARFIEYRGCDSMFVSTPLTALPQMPNIEWIADYGCKEMFRNCDALTEVKNLTIGEVAKSGMQQMFQDCGGLTEVSQLNLPKLDTMACYQMFASCSPQSVHDLTFGTMAYQSAYQMFNNNTNLASLYDIQANKIGKEAAKYMFQTCANLTQVHDITVNEVDTFGCQEMFSGSCKTATGSVHDIHVTTLRPNACQSMFASCTGLDSVYNLSAETIGERACYLAFNGCTGIDTIGNLQATTIEANGCQQMFNGCTANLRIDQLKAKNVGEYGCYLMFNSCTQLSHVGTLEADVVGEHGWDRMFQGITRASKTAIRAIVDTIRVNKIENNGCYRMFYSEEANNSTSSNTKTSRLSQVRHFRANQVADSACFEMFRNCAYLNTIPDTLYAKTVGTDGYRNMFLSTVVTETPVIAATSLGERACQSMFQSCGKLVTVNDLLCMNLSPSTYAYMFNSCGALKNTPALPATHIPAHAYDQMFLSNTALVQTPDLTAMRVVGDSACYHMFYGCTALTTPSTMNLTSVGVSGCQEMYRGCTSGSFRTIPDMSFGDVADYGCYLMFYGNLYNAYVGDITANSVGFYGLARMFEGCQTNNYASTRGYTVGELQLGDVGKLGCYRMFYSANVGTQKNTSKIATVDTLVINTVGDSACYQMFYNCSFLATIPSHLAGNSAKSCYQEMFNACALLTSVPQLPAPTAEENCYYKMFNGCSVLPATPDLPATTLAPNCYAYMFSGCKAITAAPELNALQVPAAAYTYMFNGCTALKAAPNLPATKLADNCYAYMFNGCSVMDSVMETLPAAYLANNCYQNMFSSTAITTAPVLVASRFEDKEGNAVDNCYNAMFSGCSKLNTIKTYLDNFGEGNQTTNWVSGVPATGNFFCASSLPREYGASRIPQTDADGCRWTLNPLIRMVFNPNGGTWDGEDNSNRSFSPPLASLPATQKPNCIFLRWDTLANGQGNYRFDWNNPLEGDYTYYAIYEPIDFKFTEWRDGKAIIQTTNTTATRCDIKAQDGEVVTPNILSNCAVSGSTGEYALSYDATDVLAHQGKLLNLTLRNNAGDTLGVLVTQIPFVISGNVNSSDLAPTNESDVWITNGATLTINDTREMQTLYVEGGGKIVVPEGQTLTTKRIILRAGEQNQDGEYSFCYPQVVANGSIMNATGIVNYDYLLSSAQYFNLCLPYDVNLADVLLCDGTTADKSMAIMYYDGETRTSGATGWKYLWNPKTSIGAYPTLKAGIGYTICCRAPQVTMTDGTKIRRTYSYLRLPMEADLSQGEVVIGDARTTDVVPYGMTDGALNPGVRANNAGWNLVGNPYLANFVVPEGLLSNNGVGLLELGDDNQYHWTGSVRYAVIPSNDGTNYTSEVINDYTFPAFKNFFVQIGTGDKLSFAKSHRVNVAPRQMQADESTKEIMVGVTLSGNGETDRVGVLIGEDYSEEYELNADLDKWKNTGLNVYANIGKTDLVIAAIPAQIAQNIPLTVKVSKKGSYTFSIHNPWMSNASLMEHVYLYDSEERSVTDLLVESYTFTIASTATNSSRFMLIAEPKKQPETPTTIQNLSLERPMVSASEGGISIVGLEDAKVSVYSITGTCLCDVSASETLNVAVPSGVYIVRIYQSGEMFSVQQIVK